MIKKNKPITIILLVAVIAIYGSIVYRSFYANQKIENSLNDEFRSNEIFSVSYQKDSFQIDFYLKDPFSVGESKVISNKRENIDEPVVQAKPKIIKKELVPLKWPSLKYFGFVRNTTKNKGLFLVSINGNLTKMKLGETLKELTLLSCNNDSAVFKFREQVRSVKK